MKKPKFGNSNKMKTNNKSSKPFKDKPQQLKKSNQPPTPSEKSFQHASLFLPSLHANSHDVANYYLKKIISLLNTEQQFTDSLTRLTTEGFTPKSVRFKFRLTASESIMKGEEFKKLALESDANLADYQSKMKQLIIKVTENEIKETKRQILSILFEAILKITKISIVLNKWDLFNIDARVLCKFCIKNNTLIQELLLETETQSDYYFQESTMALTEQPAIIINPYSDNYEHKELFDNFKKLMVNIFIEIRKLYKETVDNNNRILMATKIANSGITETNTNDTINLVDEETTVNKKTLDALIDQRVDKRLHQNNKTVGILRNNTKNNNTKNTLHKNNNNNSNKNIQGNNNKNQNKHNVNFNSNVKHNQKTDKTSIVKRSNTTAQSYKKHNLKNMSRGATSASLKNKNQNTIADHVKDTAKKNHENTLKLSKKKKINGIKKFFSSKDK